MNISSTPTAHRRRGTLAAVAVSAAALTSLAMPITAQAAGPSAHQNPYQLGSVMTADQAVAQLAAHADDLPAEIPGPGITKPDNSGATHPELFQGVKDSDYPGRWPSWFGKPFAMTDDKGCAVSQVVVKRDLVNPSVGSDGCTVTGGQLFDVTASGTEDPGAQGTDWSVPSHGGASVVNIVGPAYLYAHGARSMDADTRLAVVNDPLNMTTLDSTDNGTGGYHAEPGDGLFTEPEVVEGLLNGNGNMEPDARQGWLPGATGKMAIKQAYAARFMAVMLKYGITMESSSIPQLRQLMAGWKGTIDTSPAGFDKMAQTSTMSQLDPSFTPPAVSATPSANNSPAESEDDAPGSSATPVESEPVPAKKHDSSTGLILGIGLGLVALGAAAALVGYLLVSRRHPRQR